MSRFIGTYDYKIGAEEEGSTRSMPYVTLSLPNGVEAEYKLTPEMARRLARKLVRWAKACESK